MEQDTTQNPETSLDFKEITRSQLRTLSLEYASFDGLYFLPDTRIYIKTLYSNQVQISYQGKISQVLLLPSMQSVILEKGGIYEIVDTAPSNYDLSTLKRNSLFRTKVTLDWSVFQNKSFGEKGSLHGKGTLERSSLQSLGAIMISSEINKSVNEDKQDGILKKITTLGSFSKRKAKKDIDNSKLSIQTNNLPSPVSPDPTNSSPPSGSPVSSLPRSPSYYKSRPESRRSSSVSMNVATVGLPSTTNVSCEGWLRLYQTEDSASEPLWFRLENDQMNGFAFKDSKQPKMQFPIPNRCIAKSSFGDNDIIPTPNFWPFKMILFKTYEVIVMFVAHTESEMLRWIAHLNTYIISRMGLALIHGIEFGLDGSTMLFKADPLLYYKKDLNSLVNQLNQGILTLRPSFETIALTTTSYDTNVSYSESLTKSMLKRSPFDTTESYSESLSRMSSKALLPKSNDDIGNLKISIEEKHVRWAYNMLDEVKNPTKNINFAIHPSQVVEILTDDHRGPDEEYVESFLLTFRNWFSPEKLLDQLKKRFLSNISGTEDAYSEHLLKWRQVIRLRTLVFLKRWLDSCWSDFHNENIRKLLNDFIDLVITGTDPDDQKEIYDESPTRSDFKKVGDLLKIYIDALDEVKKNEPKRQESAPITKGKIEFVDIASEKEIADEITLNDFERYKQLQPLEFFIHVWTKKDEWHNRKELKVLLDMIENFNNISYWVATEICTQPDIKIRAKIVERMIILAKEFKILNNFNALMAVVSGLNTASVQRLKSTWEIISPKYTTLLQDLEDFVNPQNNFKKYRECLQSLQSEWIQFWERKLLAKPTMSVSGAIPAVSMSTLQSHSIATLNQVPAMSVMSLSSPVKNLPIAAEIIIPEPAIPVISLFLKDLTFLSDGNPKYYEDSHLFNYGKAKTLFSSVQKILLFQMGKYDELKPSDEVKEFCKHMRALKESALYKYSQLMEAKRDSGSQRLINKWTQQQ